MTSSTNRSFTLRSLLFSALGIAIMSGLSGFHDSVLKGTLMVGNQLPVGAFTYMMFVGIVWNGCWNLLDATVALGRRRAGADAPRRTPLSDLFALSGRELAVVLVATLLACFPPTSGLFRYFHRQLMLPWFYLASNLGWTKFGLLTSGWPGQLYDFHLPAELFPDPWPGASPQIAASSPDYGQVYTGFFTGLAKNGTPAPFSALPLAAWIRPMLYWSPLVLLMVLAMLALQFLVHRQWAGHEQLSYPVAQVAGAFCARKDGRRGIPDLFRNKLFWWGFVPVFLLLGLDYLAAWYPDSVPGLQTMMPNLRGWSLPFTTEMPFLKKTYGGGGYLNGQTLYFTFLGISYFVSSEISLSVGIAPFLLAAFGLLYYSSTGTMLEGQTLDAARSGAYLGYTLILLYTGRTYFRAVFARALLPRRGDSAARPGRAALAFALAAGAALLLGVAAYARRPEMAGHRGLFAVAAALLALSVWIALFGRAPTPAARKKAAGEDAEAAAEAADLAAPDEVSVLAARVLLLASAGFVLVLSWMCQSWLMAVFYTLLLMALSLVFSRIVCETGIPFMQAGWYPTDFLLNLFGAASLGPKTTNFLVWGNSILAQDPREALMPFAATGAKVAEEAGIGLRKVFRFAVVAIVAALAVAWIGSTFSLYNYNPMGDSWAARWTPTMYFDQTAQALGSLETSGLLERTQALEPTGSAASAFLAPLRRLGLAQPNALRAHYILYGALAVMALSFLRFRFSKFPLHPVIFLVVGTNPSFGAWGSFLMGWFVKQAVVRFGGGGVYQKFKPLFIGLISGELGIAGTALVVEFVHYFHFHSVASVSLRFLPG